MPDQIQSKLDKMKRDLREVEQQKRLVSTQCVYVSVPFYTLECVVCIHMGVCVAGFWLASIEVVVTSQCICVISIVSAALLYVCLFITV